MYQSDDISILTSNVDKKKISLSKLWIKKNKLNIIKDGVSPFVAALTVCKSCVVDFVVAGDE